MKTCTYCGRQNDVTSGHCWECGQVLPLNPDPIPSTETNKPTPVLHEKAPGLTGPKRSVASLDQESAHLLVDRLRRDSIPAEVEVVTHETGLDWFEVLVEEPDYETACKVAERWQVEMATEEERQSNRLCPKCGSARNEYVATESFGHIWRCTDCGRAFGHSS